MRDLMRFRRKHLNMHEKLREMHINAGIAKGITSALATAGMLENNHQEHRYICQFRESV